MGMTGRRVRGHSDLVTDGIRVQVESDFLPLHSRPEYGIYQFSYSVKIMNERRQPVQLIHRHWSITDAMGQMVKSVHERQRPVQLLNQHCAMTYAMGHTEKVAASETISDTPLISPSTFHAYHSFCVLNTPFGSMDGHYEMIDMRGERFQVQVGRFNLMTPEVIH